MQRDDSGINSFRLGRFEAYEERLALSANPLTELYTTLHELDSHYTFQAPQLQYETIAAANYSAAWSDVAYVRGNYGLSGAGQTVVVIDTGIAYDHYALGGGLGPGKKVVGGWDFAENDANPYDDGPKGFHGTHVAGIIGSQNSTHPGVAPGVDLVALRVFDDNGGGHFGWVEQSLQWVINNRNSFASPITTVNLSIGVNWNSHSVPAWANLEDEFLALKNAGIVVTVSAGNSFANFNAAGLSYPAVSPHVIPVASVNSAGQISSFSQRSSRVLAAPGEQIVSTVPDYLYSRDGIPNDFASATGTSMAAPFVAGASVLVRQAMQQIGYVGINQDMIYNHLMSTADTIFDAATNASYQRINVRRAIDALMTADDFGNSAQFAHSLGSLGAAGATISGRIGTAADLDYFSFTAATSGVARFTLQGGTQIAGKWQVDGGPTGTGNTFEFNVTAGQTYFVGLGSTSGVGNYSFRASVQQPGWGTVDFFLASGQQATGDTRYALTASRTGLLTVEAIFSHAAGNVDLQVLNAQGQVLGSSFTSGNTERVDLNVTAGQQLFVRVLGANNNVTFRCTNLVTASGDTITVHGSQRDELFVFVAGSNTNRVAVNGVGYDFSTSVFRNYYVHAGGGVDTVVFVGTPQNETATFSAGNAIISSASFAFYATGAEHVQAYGNGGSDTATFHDTAGNDTFTASPLQASMTGAGYSSTAHGFSTASAQFSTGFDQAFLYGSVGNDRFEASRTTATMQGAGFRLTASGYDTVVGVGGWGNDLAILHDTPGNEVFIGDPKSGSLTGNGFYLRAEQFARVEVRSTGGNDIAYLWDSAGDDYFAGSNVLAYLNGQGFSNVVRGFKQVYAFSTGGVDTADIYGSAANDTFTLDGRLRRMQSAAYVIQTESFRNVRAYGGGGSNALLLLNLTSNDTVNGRSNWVSLNNGDTFAAYGFEQVTAAARSGQRPRSDVRAVDYLFSKDW
jgi:subtilisin family serine protease